MTNKSFKFPPDGKPGGDGKSGGLSMSPPPQMSIGPPIIIMHEEKDSITSMKGKGRGKVKRVMPELPTLDLANLMDGREIAGRGSRESMWMVRLWR
jgi:hypothetical protein